jgi:hypothetical protein
LKVELIDMEACGGAHFLGRALREHGHEVRLLPAQYIKPYVRPTTATTLTRRRSLNQSGGRRCASYRSRAMTNWIYSPWKVCGEDFTVTGLQRCNEETASTCG